MPKTDPIELNDPTRQPYTVRSEYIRFIVFSLITLGFYIPYWGWRRWELVKQLQQAKISSFWRGLFLNFTAVGLFNSMGQLAQERAEWPGEYNPKALGLGFLVAGYAGNYFERAVPYSYSLIISLAVLITESLLVLPMIKAHVYLLNHDGAAVAAYESTKPNYWLAALLAAIFAALIAVLIFAS